jgi:hypothetical protein
MQRPNPFPRTLIEQCAFAIWFDAERTLATARMDRADDLTLATLRRYASDAEAVYLALLEQRTARDVQRAA